MKKVASYYSFLCCSVCLMFLSCKVEQEKTPNILICVADDHSFEHTGVNGCAFVATPAFDKVANAGANFSLAFASAPSCAPSRASLLTGNPFYLTQSASMNHGHWPEGLVPYPKLLQEMGYHIGYTGKTWGPGKYLPNDMENPGGKSYNTAKNAIPGEHISKIDYAKNFEAFLADRKPGQPFHFWVGPQEPHRPIEYGIGEKHGKSLEKVRVPDYFPDIEMVRNDLLDYAFEIEWYDNHVLRIIQKLEEIGELENTIIIITADHGMAFPRAKTSCYDAGLHVPLAIMWPSKIKSQKLENAFVNLYDLAPTILEAAGVKIPENMLGQSLLPLLTGNQKEDGQGKDHVICGLERHGGIRTGGPDYPSRTYRNHDYLFIKNYSPNNPPAGFHPSITWPRDDTVGGYGYVDGSPTKTALYFNRVKFPKQFEMCLEKRPMYELYATKDDPDQVNNLAYKVGYQDLIIELEQKMEAELLQNKDPRIMGDTSYFERVREEILERL